MQQHVNALRTAAQCGYLAHTPVPSFTRYARATAVLAMMRREERGTASTDAANYFDNIQLELIEQLADTRPTSTRTRSAGSRS